jgi:Uma2 family endonuclease
MSATVTPPQLLTAEEYARLPDDGRCTELVRGRVVEVPNPSIRHGYVCVNVGAEVRDFVRANKLGRVFGNDAGVVTDRGPDTVRGPDVMFYSFHRLPQGPLPETGYADIAPELVFEVLSPSDRWSRVSGKITEYLTAGVTAVCVVDPQHHTATVYRDDRPPQPFDATATLTFPDLLPGFAVPVGRLFE